MSDVELQAAWLSLQLAVVTVLMVTPLAVALATVMARTQWRGKVVLDTLILLPMGLPPAALAIGVLHGLPDGPVDFFPWGVLLANGLMATPLMVRVLRPAFEATDPMLLAVARSLGASRWRAWWTITLPMALPAIASAAALGLAVAWGESGVTMALAASLPEQAHAHPTAAVAVVAALKGRGEPAWALVSVALALGLLAVGASEVARARWRRQWRTRLHIAHPAGGPT